MPDSTAVDLPLALQTDLTTFFRLLADETRLRIVTHLLHEGELHVGALCERLGQSQPAVSHHLAMLRLGELLRVRRQGKFNYYALTQRPLVRLLDGIFKSAGADKSQLQFAGLHLQRTVVE